jgi:hypothetical protein
MNRAERRRLQKEAEKSKALITLTQGQIDIIKQEAYDNAIHDVMHIALGVSAFVLHDKFGQLMKKQDRENRFMNLCLDAWSAIESGHLTLNDTVKALKEEAGCDIVEIGLMWRRGGKL